MVIIKDLFTCLLKKAYELREYIFLYILCNTKYRNKSIRLSVSYLLRIRLDNKYLLVKSSRIPGQFQPVGGVYKYYTAAQNFLDSIGAKPDTAYNYDDSLKNDLRIFVPAKNVLKFIKWFDKKEQRECSPEREFKEELIDTGLLKNEMLFKSLNTNLIKSEKCKIKYSQKLGCYELHIRDIYRLDLNSYQEEEFRNLLNTNSELYKWFESEDIIHLGRTSAKEEYIIGQHTLSIL